MGRVVTVAANWSGGETSPTMKARADIDIYYKSASYIRNWLPRTEGPLSFRGGTIFSAITRNNNPARVVRFQYNVLQAYALEFTNGYMRVFKDGGVVTETPKTITGATQANPCVITSNAHGFDNGDHVYINNVVGMDELNVFGPYTVAGVTANTFQLSGVNSTAFGAYVSGGTVARIVEVKTPWTYAELKEIQFAQTDDTMYVMHNSHEPVKIKRGTSHDVWTIRTYARTADPFATYAATTTITGITKAANAVVTTAAHGYSNGDKVKFAAVVGMTEINGQTGTVTVINVNSYSVDIDSRNYTAYTSGGTAAKVLTSDWPAAVTFFEGRLVYGGTPLKTQTLFFSKSFLYDDMTTGTNAADGMQYTLASEESNAIQWLTSGQEYLIVGTFGGPFKVQGNDKNALTPTNIRVTPATNFGCERQRPIRLDNVVMFTQRGGLTLRSFQYDTLSDSFKAVDSNLISDHITASGLLEIALQTGRPDVIWGILNNGRMIGLNYKQDEAVQGWFQYDTKGSFISTTAISQAAGADQHWVCTERSIGGVTKYMMEYFKDQPVIPRREDYFLNPNDKDADDAAYAWALYETQKSVYHVDCGLTASGLVTGATVTPAATTGEDIVFTSNVAFFEAGDVGNEIWAYGTEGRAKITEYVDTTHVKCKILVDFNSTATIPTSGWYLTFSEISGLWHLEGEEVVICADGGTHPRRTVTDGTITLDQQVSVAHIGLFYDGLAIGQDLEAGGDNGPAMTKDKSVARIGAKFHNSLGCQMGTNFYALERVPFYETQDLMGRPPPLFSGVKLVDCQDDHESDKYIYLYQDVPLPCTVLAFVPRLTTNDG